MKQPLKTLLLVSLLLLLLTPQAVAQLRLPDIIGDHMALQSDTKATLWGWGFPTAKISVTPSWSATPTVTTVDSLGRWSVTIDTPTPGEGYQIRFSSSRGRQITVTDVAIGQVWLCAGQSNMEWGARQGIRQMIAEQQQPRNSKIRLFKTEYAVSHTPQDEIHGHWELCDSASLYDFGATGYLFGKALQQGLAVPVGLVNSSWGGTEIEMWTPAQVYNTLPQFATRAHTIKSSRIVPRVLCGLYNGMIYPLHRFNFSGVVWYQGESNFPSPTGYALLFEQMVRAWRSDFEQPLPFYYVQIAPHSGYTPYKGALIMEQQAQALTRIPNAGLVVTTDLVDNLDDIHPQEKNQVGIRLARLVMQEHYNIKNLDAKSPRLQSHRIEKNRVILTFTDTNSGITLPDKHPKHLLIAGSDRIFYPAHIRIDSTTVTVWSDQVKNPVSVRYGFHNEARATLFGGNGLPVVPFRTDDWPPTTDKP